MAEAGTESFAEPLSYFPHAADKDHGPRRYLSLLERAAGLVSVPVIGSFNGSTPGSWARYAVDAGCRCGRDRVEHLLPVRRSAHLRPRCRTGSPRHPGEGEGCRPRRWR
jgi:hypothetical protein